MAIRLITTCDVCETQHEVETHTIQIGNVVRRIDFCPTDREKLITPLLDMLLQAGRKPDKVPTPTPARKQQNGDSAPAASKGEFDAEHGVTFELNGSGKYACPEDGCARDFDREQGARMHYLRMHTEKGKLFTQSVQRA